jgi:tetratricopeptide (TPR) repeat protein
MSPEVVSYYESLFAAHVRADNVLGPHLVMDVVEHEAAALRVAVRQARGPERAPAARLTCRYEEFLGWLHQDAGHLDTAMAHTDRARDLSGELHDPDLTAYLLMRKSNIATDIGDPALALALADAALSQTVHLPFNILAVILRQKAHALAGLDDEPACREAITEALESASREDSEPAALAAYCTSDYVAMEAATCWLRLGRPEDALSAFGAAPDAWAPHLRRDYGLHLARRANAHAGVADIGPACDLAEQAMATVRQTASARTLRELARLAEQLTAWPTRPEATAVRSAVASLVGSAV